MPWSLDNAICTLADVKAALGISDTNDDDRLTFYINAASRAIERHCKRRFYVDTNTSARVYPALHQYLVQVDDFSTTTGLTVETDPSGSGSWELWDSTQFQVEPLNGLINGVSWPYTAIRAVSGRWFPLRANEVFEVGVQGLVRVTAKWGWAAIPDDVKLAAVFQTEALYKGTDTPLGATASGEAGTVVDHTGGDLTPRALGLLEDYCAEDVLVA